MSYQYRIIDKSLAVELLRDGAELVMVDFDRMTVRNLFAATFPVVAPRLASENVFLFKAEEVKEHEHLGDQLEHNRWKPDFDPEEFDPRGLWPVGNIGGGRMVEIKCNDLIPRDDALADLNEILRLTEELNYNNPGDPVNMIAIADRVIVKMKRIKDLPAVKPVTNVELEFNGKPMKSIKYPNGDILTFNVREKGYWTKANENLIAEYFYDTEYECSCCGKYVFETWDFCPYCGAEMEDKE